ncbi:MAG TPA: allantoate amidohydrolase [Burkholderiaceae bacterium]|jgi:hydantoinase/carbamoylase family amidase|nr:allantoate amidohydrolase [Burkholderiaceae bacterium]
MDADVERLGRELLAQADRLAGFTEDPPRLTRVYLSPQHRAAGDHIASLMRAAGMQCGYDPLGNMVGRYEGETPGAPVVLIGSHMDSVRNAGRFDGLFGILSGIACVAELNRQRRRLPVAVEVVAFGDEEGVRFGVTLIGSKAMAGQFDPAWLDVRDATGVSLADALRAFGCDPTAWPSVDRRAQAPLAYLESHIEQGPVLLNEGLAVGVVTAIAGAERSTVTVTGLAGHAGTVPMGARQDALAAAAEMVLAIERIASSRAELVATVGRMQVLPGAVNVIPQDVVFSIDVRSGLDAVRRAAVADIEAECDRIAAHRRVALRREPLYLADAALCDPVLQECLAQAIAARGLEVRRLPSGAGHDAMVFPPLAPAAMLFVRCGNGGISHHPDETMSAHDAGLATQVLFDALLRLPAAFGLDATSV